MLARTKVGSRVKAMYSVQRGNFSGNSKGQCRSVRGGSASRWSLVSAELVGVVYFIAEPRFVAFSFAKTGK